MITRWSKAGTSECQRWGWGRWPRSSSSPTMATAVLAPLQRSSPCIHPKVLNPLSDSRRCYIGLWDWAFRLSWGRHHKGSVFFSVKTLSVIPVPMPLPVNCKPSLFQLPRIRIWELWREPRLQGKDTTNPMMDRRWKRAQTLKIKATIIAQVEIELIGRVDGRTFDERKLEFEVGEGLNVNIPRSGLNCPFNHWKVLL